MPHAPASVNARSGAAKSLFHLGLPRANRTPAQSRATEDHATRNETPYTPVMAEIWIRSNIRYWETPRKFHGNPDRSRAWIISHVTHAAAASRHQRRRRVQVVARNRSSKP